VELIPYVYYIAVAYYHNTWYKGALHCLALTTLHCLALKIFSRDWWLHFLRARQCSSNRHIYTLCCDIWNIRNIYVRVSVSEMNYMRIKSVYLRMYFIRYALFGCISCQINAESYKIYYHATILLALTRTAVISLWLDNVCSFIFYQQQYILVVVEY
jgi:hypothetical protein